jgi:TM2 domain-containing membrane protein YozV
MDFDWGFLEFHNPLCKETGEPIHKLNNKKHCTLKIARKLKLNVQNNKLETLCKHYEIKPERFHSAICDAQATGELFLRLQDENNYNIEPSKTKTSRTIPVITFGEIINEATNSDLDVPLNNKDNLEVENVKIDPEPTINTKSNINIPIKKQIITGREIPVEELERLERINVSIWGFTLGWLGLHNFKYGYYLKGFIQLLISVLSCGFLAIVSWIWAIIESILILNNKISPNPRKNDFMEKIFNHK